MNILKSEHLSRNTNMKRSDNFLLGKYKFIYKIVKSNRIDILTVHHTSRMLNLDI